MAYLSLYLKKFACKFALLFVKSGRLKAELKAVKKELSLRRPYAPRLDGEKISVLVIGTEGVGNSLYNHVRNIIRVNDYAKNSLHVYNGKELYSYGSCRERTKEFAGDVYALDASGFDVCVFCDPLRGGGNDAPLRYRLPHRRAARLYAYSVFDGTRLPRGWKELINETFDGVLVPCPNLMGIFRRSGVTKPVYELPVVIDTEVYRDARPVKKETIRFGCVCSIEERKNVLKIVEAFDTCVERFPDVEFVMHARYAYNDSDYVRRCVRAMERRRPRVTVTRGVKTDEEIVALMKSFDVYVNCSTGEGYSVMPREALACGEALILSDIATHRDIFQGQVEPGCLMVPAETEIPAFQASLNEVCGVNYDCAEEDIVKSVEILRENRDALIYDDDAIRRRKRLAERYGVAAVAEKFNALAERLAAGDAAQRREVS
ncbi:glycosyltransferase [Mailhella sp.]|uniref:glycosyltransferase n=1 Tax=Mailhella sp. TaxID=1981029 RepID=UPI003AB565DA